MVYLSWSKVRNLNFVKGLDKIENCTELRLVIDFYTMGD